MVVGAFDEWLSRTRLFGALTDELAENINCSVLLAGAEGPQPSPGCDGNRGLSWCSARTRACGNPAVRESLPPGE